MNNPVLYSQVLRKLNITWEDDETAARLEDIISSAIPSMIFKLGIPDRDFDFSQPGMERDLFLSYCLYEFNHSLNEFDENYANDIAQVRAKNEVAFFAENGDIDEKG